MDLLILMEDILYLTIMNLLLVNKNILKNKLINNLKFVHKKRKIILKFLIKNQVLFKVLNRLFLKINFLFSKNQSLLLIKVIPLIFLTPP